MKRRRRKYARPMSPRGNVPQSDGKIFLIVVEGEQTERSYFYGLREKLEFKAADVLVFHSGATDPQNIVDAAIKLRDERFEASKKSLILAPYDEVWVVFDRESQLHVRGSQLPNALSSATTSGILVALSNPCFEFWLLIHYTFTTKQFSDATRVVKALRKHDRGYAKNSLPLDELFSRTPTAVKNAIKCLKHHVTSKGDGNPSTHVHRLVSSLNASAAPVFRII
jgi:hypothetical protein